MNNGLDMEPDFQACISLACDTERPQEQVKWFEQALEIDPTRIEDVIRVAESTLNLSARTTGQNYIKGLRKFAKKQAAEKRKRDKEIKNPQP